MYGTVGFGTIRKKSITLPAHFRVHANKDIANWLFQDGNNAPERSRPRTREF
jgi:hypothetical protein